jgi:hypothetical protein
MTWESRAVYPCLQDNPLGTAILSNTFKVQKNVIEFPLLYSVIWAALSSLRFLKYRWSVRGRFYSSLQPNIYSHYIQKLYTIQYHHYTVWQVLKFILLSTELSEEGLSLLSSRRK